MREKSWREEEREREREKERRRSVAFENKINVILISD